MKIDVNFVNYSIFVIQLELKIIFENEENLVNFPFLNFVLILLFNFCIIRSFLNNILP